MQTIMRYSALACAAGLAALPVAVASEEVSDEALETRFLNILEATDSYMGEVLDTLASVADEPSLKAAAAKLQELTAEALELNKVADAFKDALSRQGKKMSDLPLGDELISYGRMLALRRRVCAISVMNDFNYLLNTGALGDKEAAASLIGNSIPLFQHGFEDADKQHADTISGIQKCLSECEAAVSYFCESLQRVTDADSADLAARQVREARANYSQARNLMQMYVVSDPSPYDSIRETVIERISACNNRLLHAAQAIRSKDFYGNSALQDALRDFVNTPPSSAPASDR